RGLPLPPGPTGLPLLGNLPQVDKRAPYKTVEGEWSKQYGPVISVNLSGYQTVKEALVDQADDFAGRAQSIYMRMEQWIQEESRHLLESLRQTKSAPFDPTFFLSRAVSNVICSLVFGQSFSYDDVNFLRLLQIISDTVCVGSSPWGPEKDIPNTEFHYDNLAATVFNLFLAGTETTSTIRFAFMILIKHPTFKNVCKRRLIQCLAKHGVPRMEDRNSLPFTDAVIHEVQRYMDLVPLTIKDPIPKDTVIIPMLHSVLRDEDQWEKPWTFNPDHFLDKNGNFRKNPAFLPLSAGKRVCAGESLARMELLIFLVSIVQQFHLSAPGGPYSINISPELSSFTNLPHKHQLIITPR
ncbi:cytochrome P450 2C25-like, partial [Alosa sapidissima]|uniref:cytochrome P450 2C25-like n=1 Tax=Alosa sapidissima TaxID=34773 RepID=UPI001C0A0F12